MAGIDDNMTVMGEWLPQAPNPSPRTFSSAMIGDDFSSREPTNQDKAGELFSGSQEQMRLGNMNKKDATPAGVTSDQSFDFGPFSDLKSSSRGGLVERLAARAGFNAPRLNTESMRSSDLSLNPDIRSPYLMISPGLSPTTLLESPVFVSNSLVQPSPTTGKFSFGNIPNGNHRSSAVTTEAPDKSKDNFLQDINTSFAFKPFAETGSFSLGPTNKGGVSNLPQQSFPGMEVSVRMENSLHPSVEPTKAVSHNQMQNNLNLQTDHSRSTERDNGSNTVSADQRIFDTAGGSTEQSPPFDEPQDEEGDQRGSVDSLAGGGGALSEDGFNWRKYGQKQVKGSEYPRSYYKCTHPNCQVKKKVERSHEGHITEIIYKGAHNHPKPPPNRRAAIGSNPLLDMQMDLAEQNGPQSGTDGDLAWANSQKGNAALTPDWRQDNIEVTSSATAGPEYCNQSNSLQAPNGTPFEAGEAVDVSSTFSNEEDEDDRATHGSVGYDGEGDESESKRRKIEAYATEMSGATRAIREPRVVVQTTSEVDILDDGYRWRKYGQKVVKGNPNPRSYYKCTSAGCTVRKHVERASHDLKSVITTYEGKHNHDVPAARNSSHVNSGSSSGINGQTGVGGPNNVNVHRPDQSQVHPSMARFERPPAFSSFRLPGRQPLGPSPGFSFGMNQPGLANLAMAGLGPGHTELPVLPVHPYLAQQRQVNQMGFMMPKGEPKVEPMSDPGLNLPNSSAVYQQLMSRLPLGPQM